MLFHRFVSTATTAPSRRRSGGGRSRRSPGGGAVGSRIVSMVLPPRRAADASRPARERGDEAPADQRLPLLVHRAHLALDPRLAVLLERARDRSEEHTSELQ